MNVDGAVAVSLDIGEIAEIGTHFLPGNRGQFASGEVSLDPFDVRSHTGCVVCNSLYGKIAERKDILVFFEKNRIVLKHYVIPPVKEIC